ncbi:MAG: phage distal tail protein, Rcc01695 family [Rhizobiaceae bacterium]
MHSFHDVRFPAGVAFGATGGPERINEIVLLTSGFEQRNQRLADSRRRYDAGTGIRTLDDLHAVLSFFEARRGSLFAFRFRDPFDFKSCRPGEAVSPHDQPIGTGDGVRTVFQLIKGHGGGAEAYERPITKPVAGTVRVAVGGVERASPGDFAVNHLTGEVSFAAGAVPAAGAAVTAGFEFDVPVRFDIDQIAVSLAAFEAGQIPTIPLMEVKA